MATLSKKEAEQQQQQAKNGYWLKELDSLGILSQNKRMNLMIIIKKNLKT
jgi:hypothetical protein